VLCIFLSAENEGTARAQKTSIFILSLFVMTWLII